MVAVKPTWCSLRAGIEAEAARADKCAVLRVSMKRRTRNVSTRRSLSGIQRAGLMARAARFIGGIARLAMTDVEGAALHGQGRRIAWFRVASERREEQRVGPPSDA